MFSIYKASAGSGKTFTLVREVLKILLNDRSNNYFRKILAITFTNKASIEMKKRILDALVYFSSNENISKNPLFLSLNKELNISEEEIRDRSKQIIKQIIHNYSLFSISTIDKFTYRLIKIFAKDLNLSSNFTPEIDNDKLISEAMELFISKVYDDDGDINTILKKYISYKLIDNKSWDVTKDIEELSKILLDENSYENINRLNRHHLNYFINLSRKYISDNEGFEKEIDSLTKEIRDIIEKNNLDSKDLFQGNRGIISFLNKLTEKKYSSINFEESYLYQILNEKKWVSAKCDDITKNKIEGLMPEIIKTSFIIKDIFDEKLDDYYTRLFTLKNIYPTAILREIENELTQIKQSSNIVFLSEFNKIIKENIKDEPIPFIYERLGERYKHFFIDEFQDTSIFQWENLKPLIDNQLEQGGTSMIVGDAKQSIYRFRGGDVNQFIYLANADNLYNEGNVKKEVKNLDTNFRSSKNIVKFCNNFFTYIAESFEKEDFRNIYKNENDQNISSEEDGYVHIKRLDEKEVILDEILYQVKNILNQGWCKKDICILVNKRKQGTETSKILEEEGINTVSSASLILEFSKEVNLIISIFSFLLYPQDKNLRLEIIDNLCKLGILENDNIYEYHKKSLVYSSFLELLLPIIKDISTLLEKNIYDIAIHIIKELNIDIRNPYISAFLDDVLDFMSNKQSDLSNYVEYWKNTGRKNSISSSENIDAIKIMTIHKSKGLEFPVVILPFIEEKSKNEKFWNKVKGEDSLFYFEENSKMKGNKNFDNILLDIQNNKKIDNINVMYVAFTRAKNQLHIIARKNKNIDDYLQKIGKHDLKEIEFGVPKTPDNYKKEDIDDKFRVSIDKKYWNNKVKLSFEYLKNEGMGKNAPIFLGNIFHDIISKLNYQTDLDKIGHLLNNTYDIDQYESDKIYSKIKEIINHGSLSEYYTSKYEIFNEKDIFYEGEILRLDRICVDGNKCIIIDYKTGVKNKDHLSQIKKYSEGLKSIGYNVLKCILVYINYNEKVEIISDIV